MGGQVLLLSSTSVPAVQSFSGSLQHNVRFFQSTTLHGSFSGLGQPSCSFRNSCQLFAGSSLLREALCTKSQWQKGPTSLIRCEQSSNSSVDIWLGRLAMLGFVSALAIEISTGKGVLENVGLSSPLPALALGLTGIVGVIAAIGIFRSASQD